METTSKRLLKLSAVAFALVVAAPAAADELRIGFVAPMTGIFAQYGEDMVSGFKMYLAEHHNRLGGMDVKFIVEDDQGKADVAVAKAKKLVLQDHVQLFLGGVLASVGYALAPVSTQEKTLYIPLSAADDLTQRQLSRYPYMVRTGFATSQPMQALGQWACDNGYRKIVTIAADYAFGYESVGGFQKVFEDCGGKVIQRIWPPLGTKDFGPYIPAIKQDADAVFTIMVGPMALQFPKQFRAAGFQKPLIGGSSSYDEVVLPYMSDEVIGDVSALQYRAALETPANEAFVTAYQARYEKVPSYYSENNYDTAHWIDETIAKMGGKWTTAEHFMTTMGGIQLQSVRGPLSLDDMRNPIQNVYISKVEKKKMFGSQKSELWNVVIKTYPQVSQFWTYGKEEFLKQPVYSRDYPPCKFCE